MSDDDDGDETFSIRIVDPEGYPIRSREVTVNYSGFFSGSETRYTDEDGWCQFETLGHSIVDEIYSYRQNFDMLLSMSSIKLSDGEDIFDGATFSFVIADETF